MKRRTTASPSHHRASSLVTQLALAAATLTASGTAYAQDPVVTYSDWQVVKDTKLYPGLGPNCKVHGAHEAPCDEYAAATVPEKYGAGWVAAPNVREIGFRETSIVPGCWANLVYTYFQTTITVPAGVTISSATLTLAGMDDGVRVTVFNTAYPQGSPPSYAQLGTVGFNVDLVKSLSEGENRVVITLVDDCPVGNNLQSAKILLNSKPVAHLANPGANGDPHIETVDGTHYDFQGAGEYTLLRQQGGLEIQGRLSPVATTRAPGSSPYTGLNSCVSLITAAAVRVGSNRVTVPSATELMAGQIRIDGVATSLKGEIALSGGGAVARYGNNGLHVFFPDDGSLTVIPGLYGAEQTGYLNLVVHQTRASEGLMGEITSKSWLPALRDGTSVGSRPTALHDRYVDLYAKLGDSWRVTDADSLFDYEPGTSTATYTMTTWPTEDGKCTLPSSAPVAFADAAAAQAACAVLTDADAQINCAFDAMALGDLNVAKAYQEAELAEATPPKLGATPAATETATTETATDPTPEPTPALPPGAGCGKGGAGAGFGALLMFGGFRLRRGRRSAAASSTAGTPPSRTP